MDRHAVSVHVLSTPEDIIRLELIPVNTEINSIMLTLISAITV